ncbi:MAG: hypothetical protein HGA72_02650 [Chlorobiaceae bacterium]|jgi:hypothetical protein|nr:hypothetical protein [Chlorobiaceae bacterium]NTW62494.1 hypothetical protein [Chlorobiaceae bacterium]
MQEHKQNGITSIVTLLIMLLSAGQAYGWHDKTHLAVAQAAGFERWYSAAAPDVAKSRDEFRAVEEKNHYFNNNAEKRVTEAMVMEQVERFNKPDDNEGHLYGAIIGSVRDFKKLEATGKYADYPLVFCAHYAGDLSMPLHNTVYDDFNKERHSRNDGIIECNALNNIGFIQRSIYQITIQNETDLAREIARIAETARQLGGKIRKENRDMTQEETYRQIIQSASLFRAILVYVGKNPC